MRFGSNVPRASPILDRLHDSFRPLPETDMKLSETLRNAQCKNFVRSETFMLHMMNGLKRLRNNVHVHASKHKLVKNFLPEFGYLNQPKGKLFVC